MSPLFLSKLLIIGVELLPPPMASTRLTWFRSLVLKPIILSRRVNLLLASGPPVFPLILGQIELMRNSRVPHRGRGVMVIVLPLRTRRSRSMVLKKLIQTRKPLLTQRCRRTIMILLRRPAVTVIRFTLLTSLVIEGCVPRRLVRGSRLVTVQPMRLTVIPILNRRRMILRKPFASFIIIIFTASQ